MMRLIKQRQTLLIIFFLTFISHVFGQGREEYYKGAVENARAGKYRLAIQQFTNVLKNDPDNFEAYYNKGYCEAQLHDYATAIIDLNACLNISPDFGSALYYRAFCFSKLGQYQLAIGDYTHAIRIQSNSDLYGGLAFAYLQTKDYEKALKYYDLAIQLNNDTDRFYFDRASCEFFLNKLGPAALDIDHYLQVRPGNADATQLAFQIYFQKHDMDNAMKMAKDMQHMKGKAALGHYYEGMLYFSQKEFEKAAGAFGESIKADNKYAEAWFSRGMCYQFLNDKDKACADMNKALSLGFTQQQKAVDDYCKQ